MKEGNQGKREKTGRKGRTEKAGGGREREGREIGKE